MGKSVLQKSTHDCGLAVAKWILQEFGVHEPRDLADLLGVHRAPTGVLPWTFMRVLNNLGLSCSSCLVGKNEFLETYTAIGGRIIALVIRPGESLPDHWVGAYRAKKVIRVMDPGQGYRNGWSKLRPVYLIGVLNGMRVS